MPDRTLKRYSSDSEPPAGFEVRRQRVIDTLTQAYASDYLSMEEYESRAAAAAAADLPGQLDDLVSDLPSIAGAPDEPARRPSSPPRPRRPAYPAEYPGGASSSVTCILGDRSMTGNWLDSDRVNSFTLMGSTRLDLRDADLPESGPVRIEAFVLMGETVIIVPRELPVRLTAMPFMGEARARRDVDQNIRGARRWVEISGLVVMGSVVVKAAD